jgi:heparan-alpha-glucosaminide N-acetyltransferase
MLMSFGIAKLGATPTWCLWSSAISVTLFLLLYWVVDVRQTTKWAELLRPAGQNTLLTYLLPDIFYAAFGSAFFAAWLSYGWPGAARALIFTALMLAAAAVLTRMRVRMAL